MRVERLPYDYCPQLEALVPADETEVRRASKHPFIDASLYQFDSLDDTDNRVIAGRDRALLQSNNTCRELLIPPDASVRVLFGFDEERLEGRPLSARFTLTIDDHENPVETLLDESSTNRRLSCGGAAGFPSNGTRSRAWCCASRPQPTAKWRIRWKS